MNIIQERLGVVVVAAGRSTRMEGQDKQFALIGGQPVLRHTLRVLVLHPAVARVVVVTSAQALTDVTQLAEREVGPKLAGVVLGGARRQDSARRGVEILTDCTFVAIHDGARPFVSSAIIDRGLAALERCDAAIATVPVTDTIKRIDEEGMIIETPARSQLRAAQTPQFFRRSVLMRAYTGADWSHEYTDEASVLETQGYPVATFLGSPDNIKITTPADLALAEVWWRLRQGDVP